MRSGSCADSCLRVYRFAADAWSHAEGTCRVAVCCQDTSTARQSGRACSILEASLRTKSTVHADRIGPSMIDNTFSQPADWELRHHARSHITINSPNKHWCHPATIDCTGLVAVIIVCGVAVFFLLVICITLTHPARRRQKKSR